MAGTSEADDTRLKRIGEILDALNTRKLSSVELVKLERELESIGRVVDVDSEMDAFIDWLKRRQGTIMPDFQMLYNKKAEIDRRMMHRDDH